MYDSVMLSDAVLLEKLHVLAKAERRTPKGQLEVLVERALAEGKTSSFYQDKLAEEMEDLIEWWDTVPTVDGQREYQWLTVTEIIVWADHLLPVDKNSKAGVTIWGKALMALVKSRKVVYDDIILEQKVRGGRNVYCPRCLTAAPGKEHCRESNANDVPRPTAT